MQVRRIPGGSSFCRRFRARRKALAQPVGPIGVFVPCICRCYGYTQIFTAGADQIPIGSGYDTELIRGPGSGPADGPAGLNYQPPAAPHWLPPATAAPRPGRRLRRATGSSPAAV